MEHHRLSWVPIGLVAAGVLAVCAAAAVNYAALGWWQAVVYGGCAAAAAAALLFRRKLGRTEIELEALRHRLSAEESRLAAERSQFEELRLAIQEEMSQQAGRLDKREQALADRLVTYREWMEFPQPIDLSQAAPPSLLSELARKDRQMLELLQAETKVVYENILENKYAPGGQVLLPVIRDDLVQLITRVARIYQPGVEQPLLEVSLAHVFRAMSRASLQMLVVLDELPVNVKHASLNTLYAYVQRAVDTWRMYKSAEPYWPYVNTAYYLGRFALGANPLTLGAWWFVSSLGTRGAHALAQHVINRQALALLSNLVRVVGFEVAGMYGGDFRHRDANWIYASELTELVSLFPLSRDSLAHALREIGALQLRSEYDRTFLYHCLASRKSAGPASYEARAVLTMEERRAVATRLERFLEAFVHGKTADRVARWKSAAEERLGVKLSISLKTSSASVRDQIVDAIRSLASFLVSVKQLEPPEAASLLERTAMLGELPVEERKPVLADLAQHASYFFEHPDLDPDGDLVDKYLDDLAALHARTPPREAGIEDTLDDVAAYLRRPPKKMRAAVEKHYAACLAERLPADLPVTRVPKDAARAALDLLADLNEPARFIYGPARLEWPEGNVPALADGSFWLLGVGSRLIFFAAGDQPKVIWRGHAADVHAEQTRQFLATSCRLTGGQWQLAGTQPLAIRLPGGIVSAYGTYFEPLLVMLRGGERERGREGEGARLPSPPLPLS
jgi:hypothetical protein